MNLGKKYLLEKGLSDSWDVITEYIGTATPPMGEDRIQVDVWKRTIT